MPAAGHPKLVIDSARCFNIQSKQTKLCHDFDEFRLAFNWLLPVVASHGLRSFTWQFIA